jgi:hypothetical protein
MRDAGERDSGTAPALGPMITFISPAAASDPNKDAVITEPTVKVACKVVRAAYSGAAAVDKTSIKIGLRQLDEDGEETWLEPAVNATTDDTFEAMFEVRALPNGSLRFRCVARDLAMTPNNTTARLDTLLDLGPTIDIEDPSWPTYALKTPVPIKFKVAANPLAEGDNEAVVDKVTVLVSGVEIDVPEDSSTPGLYQTSVDFDDRSKFPVPPPSSQISITATNKRSPVVASRNTKVDITIDGQGPTITVKEPGDGSIVHGKRDLKIDVTDPSGVNVSSLVANFNQGLIVIKDWNGTVPTFWQSFDTSMYTTLTRLTVSISASDAVGNETTVPLILKLDNLPPLISLNPPLIREWRKSGEVYQCSALFDPVGDAPNDSDQVTSYGYFRVLVEDKTNQPPFGPNDPPPITYIAGLAEGKVELHMQRDVSLPIVVDTNNDGVCDAINDKNEDGTAFPETKRPRKVVLSPVMPTGTPYYKLFDAMSGDNAGCYTETNAEPVVQPTPPTPVCVKTPMTRVVPGRADGYPPAVYALDPTNQALGACTGDYWELSQIANSGWICVAASAEDKVGNVGVSEPLRLCYGAAPCAEEDKPSCTDGCTFSAAQRFQAVDGLIQWYFP